MNFSVNKKDLAFCCNGEHNGSVIPPTFKSSMLLLAVCTAVNIQLYSRYFFFLIGAIY